MGLFEQAEKRANDAEQALDEELATRGEYHEWADRLAYAIGTIGEIGEHSSGNNPWQNAIELLDAQRQTAKVAIEQAEKDTAERIARRVEAQSIGPGLIRSPDYNQGFSNGVYVSGRAVRLMFEPVFGIPEIPRSGGGGTPEPQRCSRCACNSYYASARESLCVCEHLDLEHVRKSAEYVPAAAPEQGEADR